MPQQQYQQQQNQGYAPQGQAPAQGQPQQQYQQAPMNQGYAPQGQQAPAPAAQQSNGTSAIVQGRIVWTVGNLIQGRQKTDDRTKQLVLDKTGKPIQEYGFGLAIPKLDPRTGRSPAEEIKQLLQNEARTLYPSGHIPQNFSLKFKDGDTDVDPSGQPYNTREGYAGHIVLACTTQLPIKFFKFMQGNNVLVSDGFKNGDYVNVQLNIKAHPAVGQGKAGLYVNPSAVQFIQEGPEIVNTPSGDQVFGQQAPVYNGPAEQYNGPQMPMQGGQAPQQQYQQPPQGQAPMNQGYAPQTQAPQQGQQMPPQQQGYAPQTQANPHYGVLPQHMQQAPQGQPQQQGYAPQQGGQMPPMQNGQRGY